MVLDNLLNGTDGDAKSLSQASRFWSVSVTRGGGLNVQFEVIRQFRSLISMALTRKKDNAGKLVHCLSNGIIGPLADPASLDTLACSW